MARASLIYDFKKIKKRFNIFEKSQAKFAGKRALTRLGKEFRGKDNLIGRTYKGLEGFKPFKSAVPFTVNSTFAIQSGLNLQVGVKDKTGKGNPAGKYLYPPIGGGSTKAYDTQFTQYLRNRNKINTSDYPFAVIGNPLIKTNSRGRVKRFVYKNTMIGLSKTRKGITEARSKGSKIQDARVIAFKNGRGKYAKGIYRETVPSRGNFRSFLRPLFLFDSIPTQPPQKSFKLRVKYFADKKVYKYWSQEIKQLAKS